MLTGLVGLHSRSYEPVTGSISIKTARLSGGAGVFFSRCSFDRPREHGRDLLTRPACGRPNARTRRLNHPRHVVSLHAPSRRRRACGGLCDVAPGVRRRTNANGCAAQTRRRGSTGENPVRQSARLAETAIAREAAARRRGAGSRALSLCGSLPALGRSTRRNTVVSSSKRSARVQLLAHHSGRRAAAAAAAALCKESHLPAFPRLVDDPRAVGPKGPWRRSGAATPSSRTLCYGAASLGEVRQGRSQCSHVQHGPRPGPSTTPQETGFERHELKSCVGGAKS